MIFTLRHTQIFTLERFMYADNNSIICSSEVVGRCNVPLIFQADYRSSLCFSCRSVDKYTIDGNPIIITISTQKCPYAWVRPTYASCRTYGEILTTLFMRFKSRDPVICIFITWSRDYDSNAIDRFTPKTKTINHSWQFGYPETVMDHELVQHVHILWNFILWNERILNHFISVQN